MNNQTHSVGGMLAGIISMKLGTMSAITAVTTDCPKLILAGSILAGALVGGLLPDLDKKNSKIGNKMKIASAVISATTKHRGVTHAPLIHLLMYAVLATASVVMLTGLISAVVLSFLTGCLVGALSHVVLDAVTVQGVPLLYPISKQKYSFCKIRTGRREELVVRVLLLVVTLFAGLNLFVNMA